MAQVVECLPSKPKRHCAKYFTYIILFTSSVYQSEKQGFARSNCFSKLVNNADLNPDLCSAKLELITTIE
jgi:hypothetical protein